MTNAKGSKSARTPKPAQAPAPTMVETRCAQEGCNETTVMPFTKAAKGTHRCPKHVPRRGKQATAPAATPEVAVGGGTVAVLAKPADAPTPPKPAGRKRRIEPSVAAKSEVPEWARQAAARDTAAAMAAVPETAAQDAAEAAPVAAPAKKGGTTKPEKQPKATPGSLRAIGEGWIASLRTAGHTPSTIASYGNDLAIAYEHLGADTVAAAITEKQIAGFNASKGVTRTKHGKPKAQPTILKTRRALRLALVWAADKKLIAKAPYSAA